MNHALREPGHVYSIAAHRTSHDVSYLTARSDLLGLVGHGLLEQEKSGRTLYFLAPADLKKRLRRSKRERD